MIQPLAGLTIIELAGGVAVRYCGQLFARLGAMVTQVGAPDPTGIGYGGKGSYAYIAWLDEQKQRDDDAAKLLAKADLVIVGQDAPDVAAADRMLAGQTQAIRLGLTWFATSGPYADWIGSDAVIQAMSGVAYATGPQDGMPMLPRGHAPQVIAGATAFIAALAALVGRKNGCETQTIDVNVLEANLCFSESSVASAAMTGVTTVRRGINRFTPTFPGGIYQANDGWIGVTALTVPQWLAFCDLIGHPELGENPHHHIALQRMEDADSLDPILVSALKQRPASYWLDEGQRRRIPLAPVPSLAELPTLPHWRTRGSFADIKGCDGAVGPSLPFRVDLRPARTSSKSQGTAVAPLGGIRVLDLSMGWAGPLAARHFADLGAEVVKVESCTHFDWWRGFDGTIDGDPPPYETRPNFLMVNRNKQGVTLDLKAEAGKELVRKLAASSDVVIENYAPGVLDKLDLGADSLLAIKPDLISLSMGAFGAVGPWRSFRAYGSTVEQASGLPFTNGEPGDPPTMQHVAYGDPVAGLYGAISALAMLYHRLQSGDGAIIDLGQVECLFQLGADGIVAQSVQRDLLARDGSRHPSSALRAVFETENPDQWVAVSIERPDQWCALAKLIGRSDLASTDGFALLKMSEREMETAAAEFIARQNARHVITRLQEQGIPAGPVHSALSLINDPQLANDGFWRRADRIFIGSHVVPHAPYSLDGQRCGLKGVSPTLGQHNEAVLVGHIGLSQAELTKLAEAGVIGTRAVA